MACTSRAIPGIVSFGLNVRVIYIILTLINIYNCISNAIICLNQHAQNPMPQQRPVRKRRVPIASSSSGRPPLVDEALLARLPGHYRAFHDLVLMAQPANTESYTFEFPEGLFGLCGPSRSERRTLSTSSSTKNSMLQYYRFGACMCF